VDTTLSHAEKGIGFYEFECAAKRYLQSEGALIQLKAGESFEYIAGYKVFEDYYEEEMELSKDLAYNEIDDEPEEDNIHYKYKGVSL